MADHSNRIALTPTIARQTQKTEFGNVLKSALDQASKVGGAVSGALLGGMPGGGIISAAAGSVSGLLNSSPTNVASGSRAATGINIAGAGGQSVRGQTGGGGQGVDRLANPGTGELPSGLNGMVDQMRTEADRSMMMQMNMQSESREYNALSNVLKTRHDSAKAAINNIR
jgi:hypothetical protein